MLKPNHKQTDQGAGSNDGSHPPIAATGTQSGDATLAEPAQFRMVLVSFLAAGIGLIAGGIAFLLYKLIGLLTNISFYGRFAADFTSARHNHLGLWVIPIPVIGGIIVGIMASTARRKSKDTASPKRWKPCCSIAAAFSRGSPS
jgi:hypothetical protein